GGAAVDRPARPAGPARGALRGFRRGRGHSRQPPAQLPARRLDRPDRPDDRALRHRAGPGVARVRNRPRADLEHSPAARGGTVTMSTVTETTLMLVVVAAACAVPGGFLVLPPMSVVSDAISHVLLFGIVLAYFVTRDLKSPWLLFGAAATGVLTVALVELLQKTRLVKEDAAIGLVFPALFALGVLLATMFLRNTHL